MIKVLLGLLALSFVVTGLVLVKPTSDGGRLSLKLILVNAVGWLILLPFSNEGHPPPFLIPLVLFWLVNLVLMPAATIALWQSYKGREEKKSYVAVAGTYLGFNFVVLFIMPLVWLVLAVMST